MGSVTALLSKVAKILETRSIILAPTMDAYSMPTESSSKTELPPSDDAGKLRLWDRICQSHPTTRKYLHGLLLFCNLRAQHLELSSRA